MLVCCGGHLCLSCLKDVRKSNFKDCPLCRKTGYNATKSRFVTSFCSLIELVCPVGNCNTAVPYLEFEDHTKTCLGVGIEGLKLGADITGRSSDTSKTELQEKIQDQKKQIAILEAKIYCHKEKTASIETMFKGQLKDIKIKNETLREQYSAIKKEYREYKKEHEYYNELDDTYVNNLKKNNEKFKDANDKLFAQNQQYREFFAKILREKHEKEQSIQKNKEVL